MSGYKEMKTVRVPLGERSYDIIIINSKPKGGLVSHKITPSTVKNRCCFIVSDNNVADLYLDRTVDLLAKASAGPIVHVVFPAGERSKNLDTLRDLYTEAIEAGVDRNSVIVALGGGVVGDTAGFMAATYMRGVDLIQIPTSLVAQVDSSVGGKTGVDLPEGKNLVGAFYQPKSVIIDIATLDTLPDRQLRCGLAEVIKYGVIFDGKFFKFLESNVPALLDLEPVVYERIVQRCCELKAQVVTNDELDKGVRAILNYGHTFGHALEKLTDYQRLTHGEAISIGMCMAADLSRILDQESFNIKLVQRQDALLNAVGLPTRIAGFSPKQIFSAMQTDKKFTGGKKRFILPDRIGHASTVSDIPEPLVLEAIGGRCDS